MGQIRKLVKIAGTASDKLLKSQFNCTTWTMRSCVKPRPSKKFFYQNMLIELKIAAHAARRKPLFSICAIGDFTGNKMRRRKKISVGLRRLRH